MSEASASLVSLSDGWDFTDYLVRKGHYRVKDLYKFEPEGWYTYNRFGINWRAYASVRARPRASIMHPPSQGF